MRIRRSSHRSVSCVPLSISLSMSISIGFYLSLSLARALSLSLSQGEGGRACARQNLDNAQLLGPKSMHFFFHLCTTSIGASDIVLCVRVCVCVCVCMCVHVCVYMCVHVCVCMCVHVCVHVCVCTCVCASRTRMYIFTFLWHVDSTAMRKNFPTELSKRTFQKNFQSLGAEK